MRIVLCYPVSEQHVRQIAAAFPGADVIDASQEQIGQEILTAEIFCGHAKVPMPWDEVVRQGRLQWIQSSAAGLDHCLVPSVIESEIPVTSASGVLADQVAEHALGLIIAWMRSLPVFFRAQQLKEYIRRPTRDLTNCTVGIVGLGGVGRRIAQVVAPFKTKILATDAYPIDRPARVEALWPAERLSEMAALVDVLILSAPLNAQTRGMIDAKILACLRPHALLCNVGRGKLVVEADLVAALQARQLAGAVMDVNAEEPLPESSKLWEMPNVIITPHVAGQSARRIDAMTDFFCDNLRRYRAGQPLVNLVDKQQGFPRRGPGYLNYSA